MKVDSKQNTVVRGKARRFEDLAVWRKAHQLTIEIYRITKSYPREEKFGLVSQMRRAAVSIPANIAEGFKKRGQKNKANFYNIAQGSLEELRYYITLSKDLGYLSKADSKQSIVDKVEAAVDEVGKVLHSLVKAIGVYE